MMGKLHVTCLSWDENALQSTGSPTPVLPEQSLESLQKAERKQLNKCSFLPPKGHPVLPCSRSCPAEPTGRIAMRQAGEPGAAGVRRKQRNSSKLHRVGLALHLQVMVAAEGILPQELDCHLPLKYTKEVKLWYLQHSQACYCTPEQ